MVQHTFKIPNPPTDRPFVATVIVNPGAHQGYGSNGAPRPPEEGETGTGVWPMLEQIDQGVPAQQRPLARWYGNQAPAVPFYSGEVSALVPAGTTDITIDDTTYTGPWSINQSTAGTGIQYSGDLQLKLKTVDAAEGLQEPESMSIVATDAIVIDEEGVTHLPVNALMQ